MGLSMERLPAFLSYLPSAFLTTIGIVSLAQWSMLAGIVLGVLTYRLNKSHKRRVEKEEEKRTAILEDLAARATQHNMNDVVCTLQDMARTEKRRSTP